MAAKKRDHGEKGAATGSTQAISEKLKERAKQLSSQMAAGITVEEVAGRKKAPQELEAEAPHPPAQEPEPLIKEAPAPLPPPPEKPVPVAQPAAAEPPPEPAKVYSLLEGVKEARQKAGKRKFVQTWDLIISLKGLDLKKPENRMTAELLLPAGRGKKARIGVIGDALATEAQKAGADVIVQKAEIEGLAKDKKRLKKLANEVDWFFGEVTLMAQIGKTMGAVLGPRGKVPRPVPPKADVPSLITRARDTVRVAVKESPVIHVPIGTEQMSDQDVLKNLEGVVGLVKEKLPKGMNNIRSIHVKLTMGAPIKLEVK